MSAPEVDHGRPRPSKLPTSLSWRINLKDRQIITQFSAILLQRRRWIPALRSNPSLLSALTPRHLHRVLLSLQSYPDLALRFFTWAQSALNLQPHLDSRSQLAHLLLRSGQPAPARRLLDPVLKSQPFSSIIDSVLRSSDGKPSRSLILVFVLERYAGLGMVSEALETFRKMQAFRFVPSAGGCNAFFEALSGSGRIRDAFCVFAAALRAGTVPDDKMWSFIARFLCKLGRVASAVKLFDLGCCDTATYDLVVDCLSKKGDFKAAILMLNVMIEKGLRPGFVSYSAILDGSCKVGNVRVVGLVLKEMIVKELLPTTPCLDYDRIISRLCEAGHTYAAEMFFKKAWNQRCELKSISYSCLLKVLSKGGRLEEAMDIYKLMLQEGVEMDSACSSAFVKGICHGRPSERVNSLLKDIIQDGFTPGVSDLSVYIVVLCQEGRWIDEAFDLLNAALEKGVLPDAHCWGYLIEHYCVNRRVGSALLLHDKMKKLGGCVDVTSYNALLKAVLAERRTEEACQVFDYMCQQDVLNSSSYVMMISSLCCEKEMRKAMKLHDEMLKLGLKPDDCTYKHLISGFA